MRIVGKISSDGWPRAFKITLFLLFFVISIVVIIVGPSIWKLLKPYPKPRPINPDELSFSLSPSEIHSSLAGDRHLKILFAKKKGVKSASGQFFWRSNNGIGTTVSVNTETNLVYGQNLNQERIYEYHQIGRLGEPSSKIQIDFLSGSTFTYTPETFNFGDVIEIQIPIETKILFTQPL